MFQQITKLLAKVINQDRNPKKEINVVAH